MGKKRWPRRSKTSRLRGKWRTGEGAAAAAIRGRRRKRREGTVVPQALMDRARTGTGTTRKGGIQRMRRGGIQKMIRGRQRTEGWRRRKRNWLKRSKELVIRRGRGCSGSTAVNWARMRRRMDPKTSMRRRESSKQSNPKRGYKRAERGRRRR